MFGNVGGLHASALVFVDGIKAGTVEKVTWKSNNQVLVRLRITHPDIIIPFGARFNILANGIIGARYVDITLPEQPDATQKPIDDTTIVQGESALRPELGLCI